MEHGTIVELDHFEGDYILDAVGYNVKVTLVLDNELTNANNIAFRLDGTTYVVFEDPEDGYRSTMKEIMVDNGVVFRNVIPPVKVFTQHHGSVVKLLDAVSMKAVVEVGTDYSDSYYPSWVSNFDPSALHYNVLDYFEKDLPEYRYDRLSELLRSAVTAGVLTPERPEYIMLGRLRKTDGSDEPTLLPSPLHGAIKEWFSEDSGVGVVLEYFDMLPMLQAQLVTYGTNVVRISSYEVQYADSGVDVWSLYKQIPHKPITLDRVKSKEAIGFLKLLVPRMWTFSMGFMNPDPQHTCAKQLWVTTKLNPNDDHSIVAAFINYCMVEYAMLQYAKTLLDGELNVSDLAMLLIIKTQLYVEQIETNLLKVIKEGGDEYRRLLEAIFVV